ncbi:PTS sugar transporter subunit IIB [Corynebacterium caspium]|uniref:PTS sugar transporter subunit IIB n=1 Tax=Corynebacterium caspium TaxID=234828 RepID=UPI000361AF4F|nr:PTS sugar transporter subunit IIB [Corynebacterium caspium]WKD58484.1 PTS system ascorbate-specific transporter subunits IICB [Corynebacterium caspium DSM 44850]
MKILAVCSTGLGSSFMTEMNIQKALTQLGASGVEVDHADLGSVSPGDADVIFVGRDIYEAASSLGDVVSLDSLIDMEEITNKVAQALQRHNIAFES